MLSSGGNKARIQCGRLVMRSGRITRSSDPMGPTNQSRVEPHLVTSRGQPEVNVGPFHFTRA